MRRFSFSLPWVLDMCWVYGQYSASSCFRGNGELFVSHSMTACTTVFMCKWLLPGLRLNFTRKNGQKLIKIAGKYSSTSPRYVCHIANLSNLTEVY